ncbi:MAG: Tat pathway signal sequence [Clostridia bacterium]|nr:Tat pathway signal sequence [Clostridia bacterium]NCC42733.1 Tat pathway signal sequence [Clostridia bacterium]
MKTETKIMGKRIVMAIVGIVLTCISVAFTKISGFGVDPYSVLMFGIAKATGSTYQVVFLVACSILTVIAWKFKRSLLGLATIISLVCSGAIVDVATGVMEHLVGKPNLVVRAALLVTGLIIISVASALYYTANLGVSPYDAQALTLADKTPVPFRFCRVATDLVCVAVGFLLGGDLGVGTICIAFCMGPAIQVCRERISEPLLEGKLSFNLLTKKRRVRILKNVFGFRM